MYGSQTSYGNRNVNTIPNRAMSSQQRTQMNKNQTTELPISEILRIQQKCFGSEENFKQQEKLELLQKSKERVKKWPNTINALRKKKDQTRFERFKVDEEERRRIEQEEAIYQAQVKKEVLEKANKQIYENNDRVRAFQSKLLLTDIIQEREAMEQLKQMQKEIEKDREEMFFETMKDQLKKAEELEKQKQQEALQRKLDQHKVLKEQHDEMKNKYIKNIQEQKIEGELLKIKVQEALEKEEEAARERRLKQIKNQEDIKKGNNLLNEIKDKEKQKEMEQDKRIEEHAKKKEQILEMRKLREEQKFKQKQAERQKLINVQIGNLQKQQNEREKILNKQIKEVEMKAENAERIKKERRDKLVQQINYSHKISEEQRVLEQQRAKVSNDEFQSYWKQRNKDLEDQELREQEEIRKRNQQLKDYNLKIADDKQIQREKKIIEDLEEQQNILKKQEKEDKHFNSWAERCIKEWTENGKMVGPLIKELTMYKAK